MVSVTLLALDREGDHTRAILPHFFLPISRFSVPQIGIGNNAARFVRRNGHESLIRVGFQQPIEIIVPRIHDERRKPLRRSLSRSFSARSRIKMAL
jgi:hypothetical protein